MIGLEIRALQANDSQMLSDMLLASRKEYILHFTPFAFDLDTISKLLSDLKKDVVYGLFVHEKLAGFHMLRGWDEGFTTPVFGVFISEEFKQKGLAKISMFHAISFCKLNKVDKLMLKVAKDNLPAKTFYESVGFKETGIDPNNQNLIYHKNLV
ncbi:MAG: GNAT family N-acetyltransferase [Cyclobacteriaceae bacterium]